MGYAGNSDPQFIIPTVIATKDERSSGTGTIKAKKGIEDLDFHIGDDALANAVRARACVNPRDAARPTPGPAAPP